MTSLLAFIPPITSLVGTGIDPAELYLYQGWVQLIPLAISLAATAFGHYSDKAAAKKAGAERDKYNNILQTREKDLQTWFDAESKIPITETDMGKALISQFTKRSDKQLDALGSNAVRSGATAESKTAAKGQVQEGMVGLLERMTGYGTQRKDRLRNSYDYRLQSIWNPMDELQLSRIGDYQQIRSNSDAATSTMLNSLSSIDWGSLFGGGG